MTLKTRDNYRPGGTWGVCDRCAFQRRLSTLKVEWTGLKVCTECFDPRPPQLDPPYIGPEGLPVPGARPDQGDVLGPNLTTRDQL